MRNNTGAFQVDQEFYCHRCDKRFTERTYLNKHLNSLHQGKSDFCDQDEELFQALLLKIEERESAKMKDSIGEEIVERKEKRESEDNDEELMALEELRAKLLTQIGNLKTRSRGRRTRSPMRRVRRGRVMKTGIEEFQKEAEDSDEELKDLRARLLTQIGNLKPRHLKKILRKVRKGQVTKTVTIKGRQTGSH